MLVPACYPATWEAETGKSEVQGQPEKFIMTFLQKNKQTKKETCIHFYQVYKRKQLLWNTVWHSFKN